MLGLDNPIHIVFILILLLLVFGAKRLPEMGRSLGTGLRGFKESISGEHDPAHLTAEPTPAHVAAEPTPAHLTAEPTSLHGDALIGATADPVAEPVVEAVPVRPSAPGPARHDAERAAGSSRSNGTVFTAGSTQAR